MAKRQKGSNRSGTAALTGEPLTMNGLEGWLWNAACSIRGAVDAPKFKDYILPLIFVKRLSDVFDDEIDRLAEKFGDREMALELVEEDHSLVRFYLPPEASWAEIRKLTSNIGQQLTDVCRAIAKANPSLQGVIDVVDFNAQVSGQRLIEDARHSTLIEILSRHRLGLKDVEPDIFGRAYEYLLRKFAEGQGSSAGEFFTPKEVGWLIARLLRPEEGMEVYDPACGSAGLLIKAQLLIQERVGNVKRPLHLYGQERIHTTYAIARMNMIIHDMEGEVAIGDTLLNPKFLDGPKLKTFDLVAANPMWNQDGYRTDFYESEPYSRFPYGSPPASSADWGWIQHMLASLNDGGRAVVVLDTGSVARGSGGKGSNKERDIRKVFVDGDLIEGVIRLPENLFYNTTAAGILLCLNRHKTPQRRGAIIIIDASGEFQKGQPKNLISEESIHKIAEAFEAGADVPGFVRVIAVAEAVRNDYNLTPERYVSGSPSASVLPMDEALVLLKEAEEEKVEAEESVRGALTGLDISSLQSLGDVALGGPSVALTETAIGPLPEHWSIVTLGELFTIQQGKALSPKSRTGKNPNPFLRTANVLWGRLDLRTLDEMDFTPEELDRLNLVPNDLLVCEGGEIGRTAIWRGEVEPCSYQNHVHRLRTERPDVEPLFYMYWMQFAMLVRGLYRGESIRTTIPNLSKARLSSFQVPLPPIEEQLAIARALTSMDETVDADSRRVTALTEVTRTMLSELMSGERGVPRRIRANDV